MYASIVGIGHHTPEWVLTNAELVAKFGLRVTPRWIEERTGIIERHWLREGETTSDMAAAAARRIFESAGCSPSDVDLFVLATISPDHPSPSTATITARKLGLRCPAFDISAACSGFLYALEIGANAVLAGKRRVLVVAADARSRFLDPKDHRSLVLFADAAAGVLLAPTEVPGFLAVATGAEGSERMGAWIPAGGAAIPTTPSTVAEGAHFIRVDRKEEIFDVVVKHSRQICSQVLDEARLRWSDVDLLVCHQGNARMVERVLDALQFPPERALNTIARHGNVSGATVPLALSEAAASGRIGKNARVLLTSVGAGYTFAAAVHRFGDVPRSAQGSEVAA